MRFIVGITWFEPERFGLRLGSEPVNWIVICAGCFLFFLATPHGHNYKVSLS